MAVTPNVQFTLLIQIEGPLREFNFRQCTDNLYNVDTIDHNTAWHFFDWTYIENAWEVKSASTVSEWLKRNERYIREKFLEHLL